MAPQTLVQPVNIVEMALDEGQLGTFVRAVQESGLAERLSGQGPYTVFAPADAAFQQYADQTLKEIFGNREELLTLVSYHIVPGKLPSEYFNRRLAVRTLLGKELLIDRSHIIEPDIDCANGVIHVIDTVLIPS